MTEGKSFFAKMSKYQIMCGLESLSSKILIDMESKEQTFNGHQMKGKKIKDVGTEFAEARVEICREGHDHRSCKICASCVNFPGKQCDFSQNLRKITRFTHQV